MFWIQVLRHSPYPSNEGVNILSVLAEHFRQPAVVPFQSLVGNIHNRVVKVGKVIINLMVFGIVKHLVIDSHSFADDCGATRPCKLLKISHSSAPSHTACTPLHEKHKQTSADTGAERHFSATL